MFTVDLIEVFARLFFLCFQTSLSLSLFLSLSFFFSISLSLSLMWVLLSQLSCQGLSLRSHDGASFSNLTIVPLSYGGASLKSCEGVSLL